MSLSLRMRECFQLLPWRFKDNDISNIRTTREKMQHLHLPALLNTLIRDKVYEVKICKSAFLKIQQSNDYRLPMEIVCGDDLETYSKIYSRLRKYVEAYKVKPELIMHSMDRILILILKNWITKNLSVERASRNRVIIQYQYF